MAKLDTNMAWKDASALVAANRDVLFALAGVFFLLPSLALAVFLGEPEVEPGMNRDQMMAALREFYLAGWWIILIASLIQIVGTLAILTLMRDRSRPTVGEAIAAGAAGTPSYVVAQLLFLLAVAFGGGLLIALAGAASAALAVVVTVLVIAAGVFGAVRLILVAPIVAVEGERNPITALRRSWGLTKGNFWRIFAFFVLVILLTNPPEVPAFAGTHAGVSPSSPRTSGPAAR
ncbi:MAG: glycerophosphoryl diester phosphodiesterase membrane domain-containing protein [Novosphingobium sp.]|nr:glycerophosphoryl diester phosphodiesterase membrane domain-containing protein [Novosphingobium sp.]